ncbi:transcriptional regulator [Pseudoalteromonas denitrificans]|uniref:Chromosome partitioning protein, ParB family n=1 Tax=Pseudoalteromonas denitrificans DSM 6059 TaxID=1123010 RepID=A0A1I1GNY9_9GAMM|nr:transcriptional regulator [Pseudoalteromonas denitrificans]SFC13201.1 chromosome partitioning protein, ParB family [Pseudoalteromonas denitrificans DSM 6059]
MVRKRKNDTRLDPFAAAVEVSSLDKLLENAVVGDEITMPSPSDPQRTIRLSCKIVPFDQIDKSTCVYGKNRREQSLLTKASVSDILPAIKADGRNQHPALSWQKEGLEFVLSGSRRRKACLLSGADYIVLTSPDFTDEDAKILAVSSDQYIAPSLWELGKAYQQTRDELIAQGKKGSYREIAVIEGVSHTAIADSLKAYNKIPSEVLALYPTANHVGREIAKKLIVAIEDDFDVFSKKVKETQSILSEILLETDDKTAAAITKHLIEAKTQENTSREALNFNNEYINAHKNVKTGDLVIKIDNKVMTEKRFEQLSKLLTHFN